MATDSERTKPRISVNKLAEFSRAKAGRQRQILSDQKYPTDFKGMYYKEASEAIALALASNLEDLTYVDRQISILEQMVPEKIGTQRRITSNIDALEAFRVMVDDIDFKGAAPSLGAHDAPKITIQGVRISVRPDIILRSTGKSGARLAGGIKLHFPRTYSLDEDASGLISAVLQRWIEDHISSEGRPDGANCYAIDIGCRRVFRGVRSTVARMKEVDDLCRNIAGLWSTITPNE